MSRIRLESDLEPGNFTVPDISLMGFNKISGTFDGFSAVATEAKTLSDRRRTLSALTDLIWSFEPRNCDMTGTEPSILNLSAGLEEEEVLPEIWGE